MPGFAFTTKNIDIHKRRKKKSFWKRLNNVFMKKNWRKNPKWIYFILLVEKWKYNIVGILSILFTDY